MEKKDVKVLIISDNSNNATMLYGCLESTASNVVVAEDGTIALKKAQDMLPDIIFIDLHIPKISSFEICEHIGADQKTKQIPVIFMIPQAEIDAKTLAFQAGAADYVIVPLQKDEVLARVKVHLRIRDLAMELQNTKNRFENRGVRQTAELAKANQSLQQKIAERDQAFESLKASESMVKAVLDQSFGLVGLISLDGRVLEANQTALAFIGLDFEDVYNEFFWETPWWTHSPILAEKLQKAVHKAAGGELVRFETTHKNVFGEFHHIDFSLKPIRDKNERVFMLLAEGRDISQLKKTGEALAASRNYLDKIINTVADPIFVADRQHRWVLINDAFCHYVGHDRKELLGKSAADFFPKEEVDIFHANDKIVLDSGKENINEEQVTISTGNVRTILTKKTRYVDEHGSPFIVGIIRDITENKRMEIQLRQAAKMEAIGTLSGGIAHDFNNMLSLIIGYTELALEQKNLSRQLNEALQEIMKAAQRSAGVTRQLLAFARKQTIAPKVLDLNHTVSSMIKMLQRLIGEDIHLAWHPGKKVWAVKMDPSQIDQILVNLCVNARDAIIGVGKLTIETGTAIFDEDYCACHQDFVPGEFVQLAVSDNGCGMEKETLMNLFEPFFTTKEVDQGTGLGLSTVYGIIKQNNGFINVYSEPQKGTTFRIYLPRHKVTNREFLINRSEQPTLHGSETILLVEDEPAILEMTKIMLEKLGYSVLTATTPWQAIEMAKDHTSRIDLLMTDVVMPEMNGRNLVHKLLSILPDLKHLFMSGYTANVIAEHGVLDEGVNFIQKPFSKKELSAKVREALDKDMESPGDLKI